MTCPVHSKTSGSRRLRNLFTPLLVGGIALTAPLYGWADEHTAGTPQLSSDPGAAYTIYLNFDGFNYTGTWNGGTPGSSLSYGDVAANGTFNGQQVSDITTIWAAVSAQYATMNINVTTVDPAVAAGQAGTDLARQTYYTNAPNMMQTIITNQDHNGTDWLQTGLAGISTTGTTTGNDNSSDGSGHTNWIFSAGTQYNEVGNTRFIAQGAVHENGHGLGLSHQSDYSGTTLVNEYSLGDNTAGAQPPGDPEGTKRATLGFSQGFHQAANAPFIGPIQNTESSTGPGTYGAIMGNGDNAQRLAWRVGSSDNHTTLVQNDVGVMLSSNTATNATALGRTGGADLHLKEDGIGHTIATATTLPLTGMNVNFSLASGVIVPKSEMGPNPTGVSNYTSDFFRFTLSNTSSISLTAHDGSEFAVAGQADTLISLRSTMSILNAAGLVIGTATEAGDTLSETFTGSLIAGNYTIEIDSFGGHNQVNDPAANFNASTYYDMGGYFLTGTGFAVPEPGTWAMIAVGATLLMLTFRRRTA